MNRRIFLRLSAASLIPFLGSNCSTKRSDFPIHIISDMNFGHMVFEGHTFRKGSEYKTEILIVGGGIAGMAAAWQLRDRDILLCELSGRTGGTSSAVDIDGFTIAQGAHYDLAYPANYGKKALKMLEELGITEYNSFSGLWEFRDKQYLIPPGTEGRCFVNGQFREDVLPSGEIKTRFHKLLEQFNDVMIMPTSKISTVYHDLDKITFVEYLKRNMQLSPSFAEGLDYNMRDDYGGDASMVSALAGIHYYKCRPYYTQPVELFSPPQGNYYFISQMEKDLSTDSIKTGHLVYKIDPGNKGFKAYVLDYKRKEQITIEADKIIYAGNKHVLKYSLPEEYNLFEDIQYAPWAIMNIVLKNGPVSEKFWQNEIISPHPSLIGFVDSESQNLPEEAPRVLTVYFCLQTANRNVLAEIEEQKESFTGQVLLQISNYFGTDIKKSIREVYLRVFGHAMPVPVPNYLFQDKNDNRKYDNLVYAGVDNHRLPLFFEALDSGIRAAELIRDEK